MERVIKNKYFKWTLVIIWMIVIFLFSSDTGNESSKKSEFIVMLFNYLGLDLNSVLGQWSTFIIRKIAHFTEYFILYLLLYNALNYNNHNKKAKLWLALLITFLYACTDEFHQKFVPDRGPHFRDVIIDTFGGSIALLMKLMFSRGYIKK